MKILAINLREDGDPSAFIPVAFINDAGYDFTVLPDVDTLADSCGVRATPGVIVSDAKRQMRFDARMLPHREPPANEKQSGSHKRIAAYRAPYRAAAIRRSIDEVRDGE